MNTLTYKQIRELGCDDCEYTTAASGQPTACPECAGLPLLPTPAHLLTAHTLDRLLAARKGQDADDDGAA